ncbi:hypothetical protein HE1_00808 [Holospora elegans E1]|uniref:Uncharacterized protein n=1 Tax=Holospora elegans E1 TaxID=1427503 RepID=A0A023DZH4_9PROT|nr:hypothetical protein [Holospora elegans]GAJ46473.1 hypothetical protein HE1_00808 [Holospora elegans E1]
MLLNIYFDTFNSYGFRPPLANTRPLEMLEGTLHIFAALHANKTLKINHAIFC